LNATSQSFICRWASWLTTEEAQTINPELLLRPLQTALRVISCLEYRWQEANDIADELLLDGNTVRQVLLALYEGGYPLEFEEQEHMGHGRPARLWRSSGGSVLSN
jgi:hypothetical protein